MRSVLIAYAEGGDWVGIYDANSTDLLYQGHDIDPERLLHIIGATFTSFTADLGDETHMPRTYVEFPLYGGKFGVRKPRERDWCDACKDDPAGQRWLCDKRPHPMVTP